MKYMNLFVATQVTLSSFFKDASVWLLRLCNTSALQNRVPKRSVHYWGDSMGILLL